MKILLCDNYYYYTAAVMYMIHMHMIFLARDSISQVHSQNRRMRLLLLIELGPV